MEYLKDLHDLHEDWLIKKKYPLAAPVVVIDADQVTSRTISEKTPNNPTLGHATDASRVQETRVQHIRCEAPGPPTVSSTASG